LPLCDTQTGKKGKKDRKPTWEQKKKKKKAEKGRTGQQDAKPQRTVPFLLKYAADKGGPKVKGGLKKKKGSQEEGKSYPTETSTSNG